MIETQFRARLDCEPKPAKQFIAGTRRGDSENQRLRLSIEMIDILQQRPNENACTHASALAGWVPDGQARNKKVIARPDFLWRKDIIVRYLLLSDCPTKEKLCEVRL
jgi:hypothetical protein